MTFHSRETTICFMLGLTALFFQTQDNLKSWWSKSTSVLVSFDSRAAGSIWLIRTNAGRSFKYFQSRPTRSPHRGNLTSKKANFPRHQQRPIPHRPDGHEGARPKVQLGCN